MTCGATWANHLTLKRVLKENERRKNILVLRERRRERERERAPTSLYDLRRSVVGIRQVKNESPFTR